MFARGPGSRLRNRCGHPGHPGPWRSRLPRNCSSGTRDDSWPVIHLRVIESGRLFNQFITHFCGLQTGAARPVSSCVCRATSSHDRENLREELMQVEQKAGTHELTDEPPADFNTWPCCGTEFNYHDAGRTFAELRRRWLLPLRCILSRQSRNVPFCPRLWRENVILRGTGEAETSAADAESAPAAGANRRKQASNRPG